jgi:hypothetical protein
MVIYDLLCQHEHSFEGWFKSEQDFKDQQAKLILTCPVCESTDVRKIPSASYISSGANNKKPKNNPETSGNYQKVLKELSQFIINNSEDVGTAFAEEAKKIHYGESEKRSIRGQATLEEVKELNEEGVDILPMPEQINDKRKLN